MATTPHPDDIEAGIDGLPHDLVTRPVRDDRDLGSVVLVDDLKSAYAVRPPQVGERRFRGCGRGLDDRGVLTGDEVGVPVVITRPACMTTTWLQVISTSASR